MGIYRRLGAVLLRYSMQCGSLTPCHHVCNCSKANACQLLYLSNVTVDTLLLMQLLLLDFTNSMLTDTSPQFWSNCISVSNWPSDCMFPCSVCKYVIMFHDFRQACLLQSKLIFACMLRPQSIVILCCLLGVVQSPPATQTAHTQFQMIHQAQLQCITSVNYICMASQAQLCS